jgi:hypothetical protein
MRVAFMENELLRVGVLVDKGADIFTFVYKPLHLDFMWQSPIEMRRPYTATSALPEGAFHDYYYGGWQEVLPSAGWASEPYLGTYQGLHGEVSLLPFATQVLEDTPERVRLRVSTRTYRSPLKLEREMSLERDKPVLFFKETLTNESPEDFAIMWGHHPAFGVPFLDEHCYVQTPAGKVEVLDYHPNGLWEPGDGYEFPLVKNRRTGELEDITKVRSKDEGSVDVIFFKELEQGWYGLTNAGLGVGFGMAWDADIFQYLWMWQVYGGHHDYPWYGRTYNCALETFTSYPPAGIKNAIENGTARVMKGGEVIETDFVALAYEGDNIAAIERDGTVKTS